MVQRAAWWMCCDIEYDTVIGDFLSEVVTADPESNRNLAIRPP